MNSRFSIILVVLVLVLGFVGFLFFGKKDDNGGSTNSQVSATTHTKGEGAKKVTLIEYGDFECPACGQYYPIVEQVYDKYKADITFQFRHFPLRSIHPKAMQAHRAAEAAGNQGKFFEMYDLLYQNQQSWVNVTDPTATFKSYAENLNLDIAKFEADVKSSATNDIINADIAAGTEAGANSTPTFVLNGKKIENPGSLEEFSKVIDEAIAASSQQQ